LHFDFLFRFQKFLINSIIQFLYTFHNTLHSSSKRVKIFNPRFRNCPTCRTSSRLINPASNSFQMANFLWP
jgi:hypothetical protein